MLHERKNAVTTIFPSDSQKTNNPLENLIENIQLTSLYEFYNRCDSKFEKQMDYLNMRLYIETDKYLNKGQEAEKCKDQLLPILLNQICLLDEEVGKLNSLLNERIGIRSNTEKIKSDYKSLEIKFYNLSDSHYKLESEKEKLEKYNLI